PNGAGKTTMLEIVETIKDFDKGEIIIDGLDIKKEKEKIRKIIGVQLQEGGFYPSLSLEQTINQFAGIYNIKVDSNNLLNRVELLDKKDSKVEELSGGQRQRFSIVIAIINNPKILFLDEPSTGLDPYARRETWKLIKDIKKSGTTIVLTTHYMEEAEQLCDRVAIMNKGQILKVDTPEKMINDILKDGFKKEEKLNLANLEDVFFSLTGKLISD
ncbi:MAG: ABC transporter ATP-binding protein, partial [Candidatus Dojkabacteria bacterium]|nr:ABC transporter ATP-binding protein [Candidatus Dojkabacteria bacterium]